MPSQKIYLITGASNGLGYHIASLLLQRQNNTVITCVRDPSSIPSLFSSIPKGENSTLLPLKLDSTSPTDAQSVVSQLKSQHGIPHLDVVLANAGYGTVYGTTTEVSPEDLRKTFETNALGPLLLFQATRELLLAGPGGNPQFVLAGSPIGSIGGIETQPYPMVAYGASKAMAHYIARRIHWEHEGVVAYVLDPGFMKTNTGNTGARYLGLEEAFVDPVDSAKFVVGLMDNASRAETSGKFLTIGSDPPGGVFPW